MTIDTQNQDNQEAPLNVHEDEDLPHAHQEMLRLQNELNETKDRFIRLRADYDNTIKRHEKERLDQLKYALEGLLKDVLPVLDSFEQALGKEGAENETTSGSFYSGMLMVRKQFKDVLEKYGLVAVESKGKTFDPEFHQAIQRVESEDVEVETVADEYAKGYVLHGRLLRPAMVCVKVPAHS